MIVSCFLFFRKKSVHVHGRPNVSRVRFCVFIFLIVFPTCRCLDLDSGNVLTRTSALVIAVLRWNFVTPSSSLCFLCTFFFFSAKCTRKPFLPVAQITNIVVHLLAVFPLCIVRAVNSCGFVKKTINELS